MTIYVPDSGRAGGPRYRSLAQAIIRDIEQGRLEDGARLPPQRVLADRLGVTIGTISRAYALVERQGLVSAEVGRGTFVRRTTRRLERRPLPAPGAGGLIDLTVNRPPDRRACQDALAAALQEIAARPVDDLLAYAPRIGLERHRRAAAAWLHRSGVEVPPERVILTGGSHQAIVVALAALVRPGAPLLLEALTYAGLRGMTNALAVPAEAVPLDDEGIRPDALDAAARRTGGRVLLVNPTLHNPTTTTQPEARRREIALVARRHDLTIIEDDVYGLLREPRPPAIFSFAPERTVYVTSASKTVAPGLRFGILSAPERLLRTLADTKYDLMLSGPPLPAEVFRLWLEDGTADRLLAGQRRETRVRQELAHEILGGHAAEGDPQAFHLWLPLPAPLRAGDVVDALSAQGVTVAPGQAFATGRSHAPHAVRLSLTSPESHDDLARALRVVREVLERPSEPSRGLI